MPLIPEPILDEIQARIDIAELIGRSVPLKRAGRHFKAVCPFHKERTPSFHVNTEKQIFHCFGCGVGGNIFTFLMQQDRLSFPEAARQLAEQAGVPIPDAPQEGAERPNERLYGVLDKAASYYERALAHPTLGRPARSYLAKRGVTDDTRQAFRLGFAPAGGHHLLDAAKKSKTPPELLEQSGVVLRSARGAVDRFRERLIFPIQDVRGRTVSFGGRSLANQEPKYLNGPETPVYTKGRHLFGLAQAKDAIVKAKRAVVVEGYFDCVWLWQAGLRYVVSPLGTAFTPDQAKLLARYAGEVVLAFDADAAGEAASLRGLDVLVEHNLNVHIAQLPSGVDPDEVVRDRGVAAFEQMLDRALNVVEFLVSVAGTRFRLKDADGRVQAAQFVLPTIARVPNAIRRSEYVRQLADRLRLDERAVVEELGRVKSRPTSSAVAGAEAEAPIKRTHQPASPHGAERLLTALVLDAPARLETIERGIGIDRIADERLRHVLRWVADLRSSATARQIPSQIISRAQDPEIAGLVSELVEQAQMETAKDDAFRKCLQRLQRDAVARQQDELRDRIRAAQAGGSDDEVRQLLERFQQLMKAPVEAAKEG